MKIELARAVSRAGRDFGYTYVKNCKKDLSGNVEGQLAGRGLVVSLRRRIEGLGGVYEVDSSGCLKRREGRENARMTHHDCREVAFSPHGDYIGARGNGRTQTQRVGLLVPYGPGNKHCMSTSRLVSILVFSGVVWSLGWSRVFLFFTSLHSHLSGGGTCMQPMNFHK